MIPPPYPVIPGPPPRSGWLVVRRVLWTATPVLSLGFLAWLPSLRYAVARRTVAAWAWFALFAGATVAEFAFLGGKNDETPDWVGGYIIALMAAAATHAGLAYKPRAAAPVAYLQGFGHRHDPGYGPGYVPGPTQPNGGYALYQQTYTGPPPPAILPMPPALDNEAAEVQAGLRELRESIERGEQR